MIETVLVALENSLNLVGVLGHYKSFVRAVSRTGAEQGDKLVDLILMLSFWRFPLNVSGFLSFQVSLMWTNISRSCVGIATFHILMALI
jgi:hypothetical protein